jgi:hypothetical protein
MYRSCIFCSADLKANDALERFPVGRSIAFDSEKGRLWAVCPQCARWNLAPIEERWEAIEDAERLFRDTRTRAQSENIGVARLRDGTRLVRVGEALAGELAVWRYGESLARRQRRAVVMGSLSSAAALALFVGGPVVTMGLGGLAFYTAAMFIASAVEHADARKLVCTVEQPGGDRPGTPLHLRRRHVAGARLGYGGDGVELHLPAFTREAEEARFARTFPKALVLRGAEAHMAMSRVMVLVNHRGGTRRDLEDALDAITAAGSPEEMLRAAAQKRLNLDGSRQRDSGAGSLQVRDPKFSNGSLDELRWPNTSVPSPTLSLALEMALHEETERRALDGELAALEEMWRQAEQIAAIADRLPDELPPVVPPRI